MNMNDLTPEHLKQEVTLTLPLGVVLRLSAQQTSAPSALIAAGLASLRDLPAIGAEYKGGKYAGLTIDEQGLPAALVLLPGEKRGNHETLTKFAADQGGVLPSRIDFLVLLKNLKAEFKEDYYWSCEQPAGVSGSAWIQFFGNGTQHWTHRSTDYYGVAVRRIAIR